MKEYNSNAKAKRLAAAKKIDRFFIILGYLSILLDVIVTTATFFFIRNIEYSHQFLVISDYLVSIEVVLAAVMFAVLLALRHYDSVIMRLSIALGRLKRRGGK